MKNEEAPIDLIFDLNKKIKDTVTNFMVEKFGPEINDENIRIALCGPQLFRLILCDFLFDSNKHKAYIDIMLNDSDEFALKMFDALKEEQGKGVH